MRSSLARAVWLLVPVSISLIAGWGCTGGSPEGGNFPSPSPTAVAADFSSNQAWITPDKLEYWFKTNTGFSGSVTSIAVSGSNQVHSLILSPVVTVAKNQHHVFLVANTSGLATGVPYLHVVDYTQGTTSLTYTTNLTPTSTTAFPFTGDSIVTITATNKDIANGKLKLHLAATVGVTINEARFYDATNGHVVLVCPESPGLVLTAGADNALDVCPTLLPQAGHAYEAVFRGTAVGAQPEYFQFIGSFVYTSNLGFAP